jgi:hypothetical protein
MGLAQQVGQELLVTRIVRQGLPGHGQPHRDRHEPGLRAVVQVTFDPAQFGTVRVEHVRTRAAEKAGVATNQPAGDGKPAGDSTRGEQIVSQRTEEEK